MVTTLYRLEKPVPQRGTLVFAGNPNDKGCLALAHVRADAFMFSFEYLRQNPARYHGWVDLIHPETRRYLDCGLFSVMAKIGLTHVPGRKDTKKKHKYADPRDAIRELAEQYIAYLGEYGYLWDHVIELDVDLALGSGASLPYRERLREVVGDRLLPVMHLNNSEEEWQALCAEYPYVAIGGIAGRFNPHLYRNLRHLVSQAHQRGTLVHGLGCGTFQSFMEADWDTGDCTSWLSGLRYGQYGDVMYSGRDEGSAVNGSRVRAFEGFLADNGIDKTVLQQPGSTLEKYQVSALLMLTIQQRIREVYARRQGAA